LITSASLLKAGDVVESLRWLRRAAGSASEAGHDTRAVDLFRAAAELADSLPRDSSPDLREGLPQLPFGQADITQQEAALHPMDAVAATVPGNLLPRSDASLTHSAAALHARTSDERTLVPTTQKAMQARVQDTLEVPDTTRPSLEALAAQPASPSQVREANQDEATMTSMSSFRVAVLQGTDGAPRIVRLASGAEAPEGAAKAVLVAV
jgi:hypothetical protein